MEVESVRLGEKRLDEEWLRITDSRGGLRHDRLAKTARLEQNCDGPWACDTVVLPAVASYDAVGRIVHVVTNDEGYPDGNLVRRNAGGALSLCARRRCAPAATPRRPRHLLGRVD